MRFRFALQWMLATTGALVLTHLAFEILGAAVLGYALLILLPFVGGVAGLPVGALQWLVLRRYTTGDSRMWIVLTLLGFVGAWTGAMLLAAALFVPNVGLDGLRGFLSFAIPIPIIGWAQSRVIRKWNARVGVWLVTSAVGWWALLAIEMFDNHALSIVNHLGGRIISGIAGYDVASSIGATLLGSVLAGAITGVTLSATLPLESHGR